MEINSALILCGGLGKRLNPITLKTPKPLLKLNNITMLENCINLITKLGIEKVFLNTYHLSEKFYEFINNKNFSIDVQIIEDGEEIVPYGTGSLKYTQLSYDVSGNYVDLDFSSYETGYQYGLQVSFYDDYVSSYIEQPHIFKFRVVE